MDDERDTPHLVGQTAGLIAMMSALVKALPPSTRKRVLRHLHAEFESLLVAMSTTSAAKGEADHEEVEWIRDLFLKRIAEADSKQKGRKGLTGAEDVRQASTKGKGKDATGAEPSSSANVDFEL